MTALVQRDVRTFPNNSAIAPFLRVKLTGGFLAIAAAADNELGILEERTQATDSAGSVRLPSISNTVRVTASAAIAAIRNAPTWPTSCPTTSTTFTTQSSNRWAPWNGTSD